jgi:hypothetical protein
MRAVMVKFSSLEADHSLRPLLPLQQRSKLEGLFRANRGYGDMRVDACDEFAPWTEKFPGPPKPIVEFLYNRIIEACGRCA